MAHGQPYTTIDDWVLMHPDLLGWDLKVYLVIRGSVSNDKGSVPRHGVHISASMIVEILGGKQNGISVNTVRKSIQNLVKKGFLERVNDPKGGAGAEYEIVQKPPAGYGGPRSVIGEIQRVQKRGLRGATYHEVGRKGEPLTASKAQSKASARIPEPDEPSEEEPEFDLSGLDSAPAAPHIDSPEPDLTMAQQEFATELERATGEKSEPRLRLLRGQCEQVAVDARQALELGWEPRVLAVRLASELNPKIHSPEKLLAKKLEGVGAPPVKRRTSTLETSGFQKPSEESEWSKQDVAKAEAARARYLKNLHDRQISGRSKRF